MKTELQDQAWASLPEDFRREVREEYKVACDIYEADPYNVRAEANYKLMEKIFGGDNLSAVEQPQPRFKVGDKVMMDGVVNIALNHHVGLILELPNIDHPSTYKVGFTDGYTFLEEVYLNPYTSPEPKGEESGEKGNDSENSLNLCELLADHIGEPFYSPCYGIVELIATKPRIEIKGVKMHTLKPNGAHNSISDGQCMLWPSRALYEQYPLDAAKAWSEWQKEQLKCKMYLMIEDECNENLYADSFIFRTTTDRDKCIGEIKSVIEKYSK